VGLNQAVTVGPDQTDTAKRVFGSPYVWLIVVIYLNYALRWEPTEPPEHRRRPGLRAAENLVGGLLGVSVVVSDALPARWYGVVLTLLVALVAATGLANLTQQLVGPPASRPHAERAR
jgi:uncharacterized membrane protein YdcZ (DUF606 family)